MSLNHSPSIVTNGLVLYTDMSNKQKSWKGQPTTNYVANADTMAGWNNYSNTANGTPAQFITDFGTTGYRMDNVGSWNGVYKSVTVPSTGTYTFSAWIKWIGGSSNVTGGAVYISGWGGGDSASATNRTLPGQWQRISITLNCTTTSMTFYLICWGGTNNADNSSWQVTMPQIEAGSYVTPFVAGTRSNTQAIVDLTGNNTLTANSLTYASDNTFSFNGSSNYVTIPTSGIVNNTISIDTWFKVDSTKTYAALIGSNIAEKYEMLIKAGSSLEVSLSSGNYMQHNSILTTGVWSNITVVATNGSQWSLYKNGVYLGPPNAYTGTWQVNGIGVSNIDFGRLRNDVGTFGLSGTISAMKVYNRALSTAEVKQNFQALRGRYGI